MARVSDESHGGWELMSMTVASFSFCCNRLLGISLGVLLWELVVGEFVVAVALSSSAMFEQMSET